MVSIRKLLGLSERAPRVTTLTATDGRDILLNDPAGWEVQQPWLWWNGPAGGDGTGGPWGNPPPGAGWGAAGVAATLPGVGRCTSIIADTIAGLPWHVMRGWEQLATPSWISDPQALRPDDRKLSAPALNEVKLSAVEFWTQWITSALWWGDGYVFAPLLNSDGSPKPPLWIVNPHLVDIDGDPQDRHYYVDDVRIPAENLLHLRGEPPYTGGHGSGVLTRYLTDLGLAGNVREYALGQYHSGIPAGYLKSSQPRMDKDGALGLKAQWLEQHGGPARSVAVLNATTDFVPLSISPLDAQLDMARTWSLRDQALAFGVPPYMLGVPGDSSTYANVESRMIELRMFTLLPWIRRIESTLDAEFPAGTDLTINASGLERADTASRMAAYTAAITSGVFTRDEARAKEGLPPLGTTADPALPDQHPGTPPAAQEPNATSDPQKGAAA